jgi:hypothetical protein
VPVRGGKAMLTTSTLTAGNHSIKANYGGDRDFTASIVVQVLRRQ